ncbi:hypothetical protein [Limosilactobacillus ingluviei]
MVSADESDVGAGTVEAAETADCSGWSDGLVNGEIELVDFATDSLIEELLEALNDVESVS